MTKAHILQEIKRTAETNGGVPLGSKRFEQETGIKLTDWLGKIWARWGDATREAGFTPNQLQVAYAKTELLKKYAKLTQQLGHLPAQADLLIKARNDSEFPWATTFNNQFGTKLQLVNALGEYCRNQGEHADIISLCDRYITQNNTIIEKPAAQEIEIGFVYLLKSGRNYKIGKSNAAGRRQYELALQLPEKAAMVHTIRTDDPAGIEAYWHNRFASKRRNGEWFALDAKDISAFKRRKFM